MIRTFVRNSYRDVFFLLPCCQLSTGLYHLPYPWGIQLLDIKWLQLRIGFSAACVSTTLGSPSGNRDTGVGFSLRVTNKLHMKLYSRLLSASGSVDSCDSGISSVASLGTIAWLHSFVVTFMCDHVLKHSL